MQLSPPKEGLYISQVAEKSPAKRAGLTKGDIITAIDSTPVSRMSHLRELLLAKRPGDITSLSVNRGGTVFTASVTLSEEP